MTSPSQATRSILTSSLLLDRIELSSRRKGPGADLFEIPCFIDSPPSLTTWTLEKGVSTIANAISSVTDMSTIIIACALLMHRYHHLVPFPLQ